MDALREGSAPYNRDAKAECPDTTTKRTLNISLYFAESCRSFRLQMQSDECKRCPHECTDFNR